MCVCVCVCERERERVNSLKNTKENFLFKKWTVTYGTTALCAYLDHIFAEIYFEKSENQKKTKNGTDK